MTQETKPLMTPDGVLDQRTIDVLMRAKMALAAAGSGASAQSLREIDALLNQAPDAPLPLKQLNRVCGVDCHRGGANCNNYCHDRKVPAPATFWARQVRVLEPKIIYEEVRP